ncbi:MAG: nicotinate (nicotinamide) nucleotide adenylyltransferase [Pirellulales bacterium]|nr:nicotinate (nicotinamide) nucleotide adenylyltransferase [Pirellulales bacterium]
MRLGIFGGSFDPVHFGHLLLAECCREQCQMDQVWFVPSSVPPHKQGNSLSPVASRIAMLELAMAGHEHFAVSRFEAERGGVCYTVDTLRHFHGQYPEAEMFLLLGADMLADLPNWREAAEVCRLALPVSVNRAGVPEPSLEPLGTLLPPERIEEIRRHRVEMPLIGLSGTAIRRRVAAGQSIRYQVPPAVERFIEVQGLYH